MREAILIVAGVTLFATVGNIQSGRVDKRADDPVFGTWKLNVAKSNFDRIPVTESQTIKYEPWGDGFKATVEIVDERGPLHTETLGKFDGKDYPVIGSRTGTGTRAWKRIDDRTYEVINKVDGKVTGTSKSVVSLDGKTLTITSIENKTVRVYEKQ